MNVNYQNLTAQAVSLEQSGSYRQAAKAWQKAAATARKPDNVLWCEQRADYCNRMKK